VSGILKVLVGVEGVLVGSLDVFVNLRVVAVGNAGRKFSRVIQEYFDVFVNLLIHSNL
jgi:hypothetical protein